MIIVPDLTFEVEPHLYRHRGIIVPSVTQVLERTGFAQQWSSITGEDRLLYFERGHWTHRVAELMPNGDLDRGEDWFSICADVWGGYVRAIEDFYDSGDYEPVATEVRLFHPHYRYAGSPDGLGLWHGKPCVLDFKNGTVVKLYVEAQTAAYMMAVPFLNGYRYAKEPHLRIAIALTNDGKWRPVQLTYREPQQLWLTALALYNRFAQFGAV